MYLETLELTPETEAMWKTLSQLSLESEQLHIAERCYAALGNVSRVRYIRTLRTMAETNEGQFRVKAKLAVLDKQFKVAEALYLEQGYVDDAMEMYQELHKWDDALRIAETKNHPEVELLRRNYFQWLTDTQQEEQAGQVGVFLFLTSLLFRDTDYVFCRNLVVAAGSSRALSISISISNLV